MDLRDHEVILSSIHKSFQKLRVLEQERRNILTSSSCQVQIISDEFESRMINLQNEIDEFERKQWTWNSLGPFFMESINQNKREPYTSRKRLSNQMATTMLDQHFSGEILLFF